MEKVLITGSAGYVGSVLTPLLLAEGYAVRALDLYRHRSPGLLSCCGHPHFSAVRGDCRDRGLVKECVKGVDWIIPLAAIVGAPACDRADPREVSTTNVSAVQLLLDNLIRSKDQRLLFPTTNSGYGVGGEGVCTEDSPLRPVSLYGKTKVQAEEFVMSMANTLSFRFATAFGPSPRMRLDLLVNDFVHRAVTDRAVVLYEGHFRRNYVHAHDMARAFLHGMKNWDAMRGRAYNVGLSDANLTKAQLCEEIKKEIPAFQWFDAPVGEDPDKRDYLVSNARVEGTGFRCAKTLRQGICELIRAYTMLPGKEFTNL